VKVIRLLAANTGRVVDNLTVCGKVQAEGLKIVLFTVPQDCDWTLNFNTTSSTIIVQWRILQLRTLELLVRIKYVTSHIRISVGFVSLNMKNTEIRLVVPFYYIVPN